jgi:hypothetical protein
MMSDIPSDTENLHIDMMIDELPNRRLLSDVVRDITYLAGQLAEIGLDAELSGAGDPRAAAQISDSAALRCALAGRGGRRGRGASCG